MATVGAVYCVYDVCPLLEESVARIYCLVDKIVFLVNFKPWCGNEVDGAVEKTLKNLLTLPDYLNKIEIVSKYWADEKDQRNDGLRILKSLGIDWCLIIDDDEFYNHSELKSVFDSLESAVHAVYLFYHQIYWKDRYTAIESLFGAFPTLTRTDGTVFFIENRMIFVNRDHTWFNISAEDIVCHHLSYVRSDEDVLKKVNTFSHAADLSDDWYTRVWVHWHEDMINLHPTTPEGFKRAIPAVQSVYRLVEI